jgi:L-ascorbate metabolism protein UlaG (beta-lactamase superfamily)
VQAATDTISPTVPRSVRLNAALVDLPPIDVDVVVVVVSHNHYDPLDRSSVLELDERVAWLGARQARQSAP